MQFVYFWTHFSSQNERSLGITFIQIKGTISVTKLQINFTITSVNIYLTLKGFHTDKSIQIVLHVQLKPNSTGTFKHFLITGSISIRTIQSLWLGVPLAIVVKMIKIVKELIPLINTELGHYMECVRAIGQSLFSPPNVFQLIIVLHH